ncbi:hypothetical protein [Nocardia jiangsuensis]|uniref:Uncharacterized protein n=1 Tax=Nocardia jiangsuensis TaxID=1691563 RepID=A0ABV8DUK6_9NOCA
MILTTTLPAQAAGAAAVTTLAGVYSPSFYSGDTVTDVQVLAPYGFPSVAGQATDNVTISVRLLRDGVPVQTFAALTVGTGITVTAATPVPVPIIAQPTLLPSDVLDVRLQQNGAGQAIGPGLIVSVFVS